jgi:crossover junction endodeoxyribonuclease RuvC
VIAGLDPGATGALALLDPDGQLVAVHDLPYLDGTVSAPLLAALLRDVEPISTAWVERAQAMPRQGIASTFRYGMGFGCLLGVLGALHIPVETVRPAEWKRAAGLSSDKAASRRRACELWPAHAERFARVKDDGRAEAALIGRHGWLTTKKAAA